MVYLGPAGPYFPPTDPLVEPSMAKKLFIAQAEAYIQAKVANQIAIGAQTQQKGGTYVRQGDRLDPVLASHLGRKYA